VSYRRNKYRQDIIERFGQETGLPLFEQKAPEGVLTALDQAPKSMYVATETRKLAETIITHDEHRLGEKQQKVLDTMYLRDDWTNEELAHKLEWGINRVVGRVFELRERGLVVPAMKRVCGITGNVVQAWKVK
jgi:hypothetical protein